MAVSNNKQNDKPVLVKPVYFSGDESGLGQVAHRSYNEQLLGIAGTR